MHLQTLDFQKYFTCAVTNTKIDSFNIIAERDRWWQRTRHSYMWAKTDRKQENCRKSHI